MLAGNAVPATEFFRIPSDRVVELGVRIAISRTGAPAAPVAASIYQCGRVGRVQIGLDRPPLEGGGDQGAGIVLLRIGEEFRRRPFLHYPPPPQHDDAMGERADD